MNCLVCREAGRSVLIAFALVVALASVANSGTRAKARVQFDLTPITVNPSLWQASPSALIKQSNGELKQGLCKSELMYANRGQDAIRFLGSTIEECVVRLEGQKARNVYVLLRYAKNEEQLPQLKTAIAQAEELLSRQCRTPGKRLTFTFANGREVSIRQWQTPAARIYLHWNDTLPATYLSALVERVDLPEREMRERLSVSGVRLPAHEGGKGRVLAVPMRHQLRGLGACESATLTRQLAYLGSEVEPQMLSQMLSRDEARQLDLMGKELGFYRKIYHLYPSGDARRNAADLLMRYNALAGSRGLAPIKYEETATTIGYGDQFARMNVALLKEIPPVDGTKYAQFRKIVTAAIDQGVPVSWTVVRSSPKNGKGGGKHRRLIIGYDADQDLVCFSDTWGFTAEQRTMPFRAAFAMTVWMQALCPDSLPAAKLP